MPVSNIVNGESYFVADSYSLHVSRRPAIRLDRALSIMVMHPASRVLGQTSRPRIPILMYHGINRRLGRRHPYFETNTAPSVFESHMRFLHANGYTVIRLDEVAGQM